MSEYWLSEEQFERLRPLLPTKVRGVARIADRQVIGDIVPVLRAGCRWKGRRAPMAIQDTLQSA